MTHKVYIVTDLGPGDGGKGGVVHKVANMTRAHTVIKVGGAQGSHGVRTARGESFAFSQWGCGTFEGIRTYLSPRMIVSPEGLLNEADALRYQHGIQDPFGLLTVDERTLCATPYHGIASRLKEMARGNNPRGTIGTGVGETFRYHKRLPELSITSGQLDRNDLREKLASVREEVSKDLIEILNGEFLPGDQEVAEREISLLRDDGFLEYVIARFQEVAKRANIVDADYFEREILPQEGIAVVESSHGILTDNVYGFHPHTSAIRTLPKFTHAMLQDSCFEGEIVDIGVTRAYGIRHGAGPMPTADPMMTERLLPGSHKEENRYQGKIRVGPLDLVLLRYALEVCGGPTAFSGLAITWFDQVQENAEWRICNRYKYADDPSFFVDSSRIAIASGTPEQQYQEDLGKELQACIPEIEVLQLPSANRQELYTFCADVLDRCVNVPVRMVSFGPTELEKLCR